MPGTIANPFVRFGNQLRSVLSPESSSSFGQKSDCASTAVDLAESVHDRKRLRKMPFTVETFQYVMKRMSVHSCVARLICQADVPTFQKTTTEMTLYPSSCATGEAEPAIRKSGYLAADVDGLSKTYIRQFTIAEHPTRGQAIWLRPSLTFQPES
jgi:hypothetical protein